MALSCCFSLVSCSLEQFRILSLFFTTLISLKDSDYSFAKGPSNLVFLGDWTEVIQTAEVMFPLPYTEAQGS